MLDLGGLLVIELSKDNSIAVFSCAFLIGMSDLGRNVPEVESMLKLLMEDHLERANFMASEWSHQELRDKCPRTLETFFESDSQMIFDYIRSLLPKGRISHHALMYAVCRLAYSRIEAWRWSELIKAEKLEEKLMTTLRSLDQEADFHFCHTDDDLQQQSP